MYTERLMLYIKYEILRTEVQKSGKMAVRGVTPTLSFINKVPSGHCATSNFEYVK